MNEHLDRDLEYTDGELENLTTSELIRTTFQATRKKYPITYAFNSTPCGQNTELSKDAFGFIDWTWKIFRYNDDQIFNSCGFSAIVYLRFLRLGFKLSAWGIFNSIYLIPINIFGCNDDADACTDLEDAVNRASLGNVSMRSPSLFATTFAAYVIFGKAMHYIFIEFKWFTQYRHKFSIEPKPDNYTVYVAHIPKEYRSDVALLEYFRSIFSFDDVLEAKIALDIPTLDKRVARRKVIVQKIEHNNNLQRKIGHIPPSNSALRRELDKLNEKIGSVITEIASAKAEERKKFMHAMFLASEIHPNGGSSVRQESILRSDHFRVFSKNSRNLDIDTDTDTELLDEMAATIDIIEETSDDVCTPTSIQKGLDESLITYQIEETDEPRDNIFQFENEPFIEESEDYCTPAEKKNYPTITPAKKRHKRNLTLNSIGSATSKTLKKTGEKLKKTGEMTIQMQRHIGDYSSRIGKTLATRVNSSAILVKKVAGQTVKNSVVNVKDLAVYSSHLATKTSKRLTRLILNSRDGDGKVLESGFVTFTNLSTKAQCEQIIHHETPYRFLVGEAPRPKDVIWTNVGKSHEEIHAGIIVANAATVGLMILWTIPVAFFTSLSEADALKEVLPFLEKVIQKHPWVTLFSAQLAPLFLVILTEILPTVLSFICKYEGHVGKNAWNASMITKLAFFMVIQIFFVQVISGSIFDELKKMLKDSTLIINLLATSIPTQVKSFIQFILVQMFVGCSIELLRVLRVFSAFFRKRFGPDLTEKERGEPYLFLQPITISEEMEYPMRYAELILYFLVNLVYSCVAPLMSYFMLLAFGVLNLVYRHQLIYIYTSENDHGGKLWPQIITMLIVCMLVAEMTLIGIVSIKQGAIAASLMLPLVGATVFFLFYIHQQHFRVTHFVPSTLCKSSDIKNHATLDISFLNDQYLQPSMKEKELHPDNDNVVLEDGSFLDVSIECVPSGALGEVKDCEQNDSFQIGIEN